MTHPVCIMCAVRISIYYVLWCDSGLPVRLALVGYCLCRRCQTCGQMGTHLKRRGQKQLKNENALSVGYAFPLGLSKLISCLFV